MTSHLLNAEELRALKRPVVQKIAKVCIVLSCPCSECCVLLSVVVTDHRRVQREGIRATGKTENIIAALLDAYPNGVEP